MEWDKLQQNLINSKYHYFHTDNGVLLCGDCLEVMKLIPRGIIDCVITSPPYWVLRDYGVDGQIGLESTFQEYLEKLWSIFREIYGSLKSIGTCWVVIGDTYSGSGKGAGYKEKSKHAWSFDKKPKIKEKLPPKCLCMIPERFAIGMIDRNWILRNEIVWEKPNCLPESVSDRFTKSHEKIFFFVKQRKYYFKQQLEPYVSKPTGKRNKSLESCNSDYPYGDRFSKGARDWYSLGGRNKRTVWRISTRPTKHKHFACVDENTEILTMDGWKNFNEISKDDYIATFDILNERIQYHKPYDILYYNYEGNLVTIRNQWVDQTVTPNHRVLLKYIHTIHNSGMHGRKIDKYWHYVEVDELRPYSGILLPNAGIYDGVYNIGEHKAELLGWIITEGYIDKSGSICIYQSYSANPMKVERIEFLLKSIYGDKYRKYIRRRKYKKNRESVEVTFRLNKTQIDVSWIYQWIGKDKKPSWNLLHLKYNELKSLYEGLIMGDGYRRKDGRDKFIQNSKYIQDWFKTLCVHLGKRTVLSKKARLSSCLVTYVTNQNYTQIHPSDFREVVGKEYYKGVVWCPYVPNTNFVAKRNEKIFITGNTFPIDIPKICIKAGCSDNGIVLDPFLGSGTTAIACEKLNRRWIGIEINPEYCGIVKERVEQLLNTKFQER